MIVLEKLAILGIIVVYLGGMLMFARWCFVDAEKRGVPGFLVFFLVFSTFPLGWAIWLGCRPPEKRPFGEKTYLMRRG